MKRKGSLEFSMNGIIYLIVLLVISFIIYVILNGRATGTETIIKNTDPSLGSNNSKTDYCNSVCDEDPDGDKCITDLDLQLGITCRAYLDNLEKTIEATYPEKMGVGVNKIIIALSYNTAPLTSGTDGATISGPYITSEFSDATTAGSFEGTVDTTNVQVGYITLTASATGYPSRPITMLVDQSSALLDEGGGGGGGGGGTGVILYEDAGYTKTTSSIKAGVFVYVRMKVGESPEEVPASMTVTLWKSGTDKTNTCDLAAAACIETSGNSFRVPRAALFDSSYTVKITAVNGGGETAERSVSFSWSCPAVVFDKDKPFGPGKQMGAVFESNILDKDDVVVKLNNQPVATASTNLKEIFFDLPKMWVGGFVDGKNTLRVERAGAGKNVLCIKTANSIDYVINYVEKDYTWSCSSQAGGCEGDYVLSSPSESGTYTDTETGCRYTTKAATACLSGCTAGKCKEPKLEISKVYLEGKEIGVSRSYENLVDDRLINITVKNIGTLLAVRVGDHFTVKLGTDDLGTPISGLSDIEPGKSENYTFILPKETPTVPLSETSVTLPLAISAGADNIPTAVTWSKNVVFYGCGYNCAEYDATAPPSKSQAYCTACSSSCRWDGTKTPSCINKCGDMCGTYSKTDCPKCSLCIWNNIANTCQKKA